MNEDEFYYSNFRPVDLSKCSESRAVPFLYTVGGNLFYKINKSGKNILVKLSSKTIKESIQEIEKRKIHQRDTSHAPRQRVEKMKNWYAATMKLKDCVEFFSWKPFRKVRYVNSSSTIDADFDFRSGDLTFNPAWVLKTDEEVIIKKLREFVLKWRKE